jgi:hypothetical protein
MNTEDDFGYLTPESNIPISQLPKKNLKVQFKLQTTIEETQDESTDHHSDRGKKTPVVILHKPDPKKLISGSPSKI